MRFYRRINPVQAISFDLDDTLYDNRPVISRAEAWLRSHLLNEYPHITPLKPQGWRQLKRTVLSQSPQLQHDVSEARIAILTELFSAHGYTTQSARTTAEQIFTQFFAVRSDFEVSQKNHAVLAKLAARYPLVAITNGNVDLDRVGLTSYFQHVFKAGDGIRMKPYPDLFQQAEAALGIHGRHILHVGDHLTSDVAGAINNGFQAAWFNNTGKSLNNVDQVPNIPDIEITDLDELISLL